MIKLVQNSPSEGGAWTGPVTPGAERDWTAGVVQPPMPQNAVVLGDFNMHPESPEYAIIATATAGHKGPLLTDIWAQKNPGSNVLTWHPNPGRPGDEHSARLDYCFVTADLNAIARASWVDESAQGSDHQPLWVELETG